MDPQLLDPRVREAWQSVRRYFDERSAGMATSEDDPQPALAGELFRLWVDGGKAPHLEQAMSTAFQMWGNTSRAAEVETAMAQLDVGAAYWGAAIRSLARTYSRTSRGSEILPALHRLEGILTHPDSLAALYDFTGMTYLRDRDPGAAATCFHRLLALAPEGERGERARAGLYEVERLQPGQLAPPIEATTLEGDGWSLEDQVGKVVCIEFWSTDCGFCGPEMAFLREARAACSGHDLVLLGVSQDQDEHRLREVLDRERLRWPQVWEPVRWHGRVPEMGPVTRAYNARAIPRSVLIDRAGRIIAMDLRRADLLDAIRAAVEPPAVSDGG